MILRGWPFGATVRTTLCPTATAPSSLSFGGSGAPAPSARARELMDVVRRAATPAASAAADADRGGAASTPSRLVRAALPEMRRAAAPTDPVLVSVGARIAPVAAGMLPLSRPRVGAPAAAAAAAVVEPLVADEDAARVSAAAAAPLGAGGVALLPSDRLRIMPRKNDVLVPLPFACRTLTPDKPLPAVAIGALRTASIVVLPLAMDADDVVRAGAAALAVAAAARCAEPAAHMAACMCLRYSCCGPSMEPGRTTRMYPSACSSCSSSVESHTRVLHLSRRRKC